MVCAMVWLFFCIVSMHFNSLFAQELDGGGAKAFPQKTEHPLSSWSVQNAVHSLQDGLELRVNITHLSSSGQWVELSWQGVVDPADDDVIALYVPANASATELAPAKFKWAAKEPSHLNTGSGTTRFRLLNMRQDMRFAFVRGGLFYPRVAAYSDVLRFANPNEPTQGHLALTGKEGEMLVQWTTWNSSRPEVKWGTASGHYTGKVEGRWGGYSREDMCGGVARGMGWMEPGRLHSALLTALAPDTRYYYRFGDEEWGWSEEFDFTTPPPVGPSSEVEFLAIADLGDADIDGSNQPTETIPSLATTALMQEEVEGKRLLIHNGDISYAQGFSASWDVFFDQLRPLQSRMAHMVVVGNHEVDWPGTDDRFNGPRDSGGECGVATRRRLKMPTASESDYWYSFDFGPIHFLQYSTEHDFALGSPQYRFIESDLRSVDRSRTPWLVVGGHRPFYISSTYWHVPDGDQDVAQDLRAALEQLFFDYKVDMTWHGHHHSYQRSCPMMKGECLAANADGSFQAPVHLVIGHAGAGLCYNVIYPQPHFWEVVDVQHGYMRVKANATHMHCQVIANAGAKLMDDFTLFKPSLISVTAA